MGDGDYFRGEKAPCSGAGYSTRVVLRRRMKHRGLQETDLPLALLANT